MWDNAAVRVIMGGAGNVRDLDDVATMGDVRAPSLQEMARTEGRRVLSPDKMNAAIRPGGCGGPIRSAGRGPTPGLVEPSGRQADRGGQGRDGTSHLPIHRRGQQSRGQPASWDRRAGGGGRNHRQCPAAPQSAPPAPAPADTPLASPAPTTPRSARPELTVLFYLNRSYCSRRRAGGPASAIGRLVFASMTEGGGEICTGGTIENIREREIGAKAFAQTRKHLRHHQ